MGSKEEWEELEKWQKEYENKKEKEMKIDIKQFKSKDTKKAKAFSLLFNFTSKTIIGILASILAIIAITTVIWFYNQLKTYIPKDIIKELQNRYKGEKFEIIEDYSKTTRQGLQKGLYIVSPQNNKNIKFKLYNKGAYIMEDYPAQRLKYYIENYPNKEFLKEFDIEEKAQAYETYENTEFLQYNVSMKVNDYNEIEEKTSKAYKLASYIKSQDDKIYDNISLINIDINCWIPISSNTNDNIEDIIYNSKYQYINSLKKANRTSQLNQIGQEEIEDIWKPEELLLYINDKQMKLYNNLDAKVYYSIKDKSYHMSGADVFLKQVEQIEILKQGILSKNIKKVKYNNKTYKISTSSGETKNENNVIYMTGKLDDFCKKFNTEPIYDYENEKVYITIK